MSGSGLTVPAVSFYDFATNFKTPMKLTGDSATGFCGLNLVLMTGVFLIASNIVLPAQTAVNNLAFSTTPLIEAVKTDNTNEVLRLLNNGSDINAKDYLGTTALMSAVISGDADTVKLLLDRGADVNAKDNQGFTVLMNSSFRRYDPATGQPMPFTSSQLMDEVKIHKLLLDKGADINAKDNQYGDTALAHLALLGFTNTVALLLDRGADINAKNNAGETALISLAGVADETDSVRLLLARGANINAVNNAGETALGVAKRNGNKVFMRLLQQAGAVALSASDSFFNPVVASHTNTDNSGYVTNSALLDPFTVTNSSGEVFTDAVLVRLTPSKFTYKTATGAMGVLPLASLPEDLQKKFGYIPQNAQAADEADQQKKVRQQQVAQQRQELAAQQANPQARTQVQPASSDISRSIRAFAEKEFPDDYQMQQFVIKQQTEAYNWVASATSAVGIPSDVYAKIKAKAADEFPGDYNMQKFVINQQVKAYTELH